MLPPIRFTASVDVAALVTFEREWRQKMVSLAGDLDDASLKAARAGISAVWLNHPYKDHTYMLTDTADARPARGGRNDLGRMEANGGAYMEWPMFYAGWVNDGTDRSRPYPFVPIAIRAAERALRDGVRQVIAKFAGMK